MADDRVWQYLDKHPEDYDTFKIGHRYWLTYRALLLFMTHILYDENVSILDEKDILKRIIQQAWYIALTERVNIAMTRYESYIETAYKWNPTRSYERIGSPEPWANTRDKEVMIVYDEKPLYVSPYMFHDDWLKERKVYEYEVKIRWLRWRKFLWQFVLDWASCSFM